MVSRIAITMSLEAQARFTAVLSGDAIASSDRTVWPFDYMVCMTPSAKSLSARYWSHIIG